MNWRWYKDGPTMRLFIHLLFKALWLHLGGEYFKVILAQFGNERNAFFCNCYTEISLSDFYDLEIFIRSDPEYIDTLKV